MKKVSFVYNIYAIEINFLQKLLIYEVSSNLSFFLF